MLGLDFGTTNSAVGVAAGRAAARLARFPGAEGETPVFRSVLHFSSAEDPSPHRRPDPTAGPAAVAAYLDEGGGRFLQSLKSYLASRLFEETTIHGWRFTLEELVAIQLRALRAAAREQLGDPGDEVLLGRPVHFVLGDEPVCDPERDAAALARLERAALAAGFSRVEFEYEPIAAAFEYERDLERDELVLIGDFGGGTSDFCLARLGPGQVDGDRAQSILAVGGVPLAGGAFDGRIVRHVVSPRLGLGSQRRTAHGKDLPVPSWIYSRLERWEDVSVLGSRDVFATLRQVEREAVEPSKIRSLVKLVEDDLGYLLYRAVEEAKVGLSSAESSRLLFRELPRRIDQQIARAEFDLWIEDHVRRLESCVDALLVGAGVERGHVERVFLTGGTSLVPRVRRIFDERFGAERVRGGEELVTVARGLASLAAERAARRA